MAFHSLALEILEHDQTIFVLDGHSVDPWHIFSRIGCPGAMSGNQMVIPLRQGKHFESNKTIQSEWGISKPSFLWYNFDSFSSWKWSADRHSKIIYNRTLLERIIILREKTTEWRLHLKEKDETNKESSHLMCNTSSTDIVNI